jgi:hypothetical protein
MSMVEESLVDIKESIKGNQERLNETARNSDTRIMQKFELVMVWKVWT